MITIRIEQVVTVMRGDDFLGMVKRDENTRHQIFFKPVEMNGDEVKGFLETIANVSNNDEK